MGYIVKQSIKGFMLTLYCEAINSKYSQRSDIVFENMDDEDFPKELLEVNLQDSDTIKNKLNPDNSKDRIVLTYEDMQYLNIDMAKCHFNGNVIYYCDWT